MGIAEDKIAKARIQLKKKAPYLTRIIYKLVFIEAPGLKTVGVTETMLFLYDPKFVESVTEDEMIGLFMHEVLHIKNKHMSRQTVKFKISRVQETNETLTIWNRSADKSINDPILESGFKLPANGCFASKSKQPVGNTAEWYFDEDMKQQQQNQQQQNQQQQNQQQQKPGQQQQGRGGQQQGQSGGAFSDCLCKSDLAKKIVEANKEHERTPQEVDRSLREMARDMKEFADKHPGKVSSNLLIQISDLLEPAKVPWSEILLDKVSSIATNKRGTDDYSYARTNRRQGAFGYVDAPLMLGIIKHEIEVVVAIDTSGSMFCDNSLKKGVTEVLSLVENASISKLTFIVVDTQINNCREVKTREEVLESLSGMGGTNLDSVFHHIRNTEMKCDLLIFITDGYDYINTMSVPYEVIWCVTCDNKSFRPSFGERIYIDEQE